MLEYFVILLVILAVGAGIFALVARDRRVQRADQEREAAADLAARQQAERQRQAAAAAQKERGRLDREAAARQQRQRAEEEQQRRLAEDQKAIEIARREAVQRLALHEKAFAEFRYRVSIGEGVTDETEIRARFEALVRRPAQEAAFAEFSRQLAREGVNDEALVRGRFEAATRLMKAANGAAPEPHR